jgi:hypothetical protein
MVGVTGSMPRSASFEDFETESMLSARWMRATSSSPSVFQRIRAVDRIMQLEIATAVPELCSGLCLRCQAELRSFIAQQPVVELAGGDGTDDIGMPSRSVPSASLTPASALPLRTRILIDIGSRCAVRRRFPRSAA